MLLLTWDSKIYSRFRTSAVVHYPQTFQSNPHSQTMFPYGSFQCCFSICVLCDISYKIKCLLMGFVSQSNSKLEDDNFSATRDSLLGVLRAELHLTSEKATCHCHSNRKMSSSSRLMQSTEQDPTFDNMERILIKKKLQN